MASRVKCVAVVILGPEVPGEEPEVMDCSEPVVNPMAELPLCVFHYEMSYGRPFSESEESDEQA